MATKTQNLNGPLIAAVMVLILVIVLLVASRSIGNVGKIRAIGLDIFADKACTTPLTQIDWGLLSPGEMAAVTWYGRNSGNVNFTMSFNITDWNPGNAANYLLVSWNYSGQLLHPLEVFAVQTTLTVALNITEISTFSYTMTVYAVEAK